MNIFKSPSTSSGQGRPRPAHSIRGKISGPIPIPNPADDDDEFPIRNPGTNLAANNPEEEFPIRQRGAGIASPTPLEEQPTRNEQRDSQRSEALAPPPAANSSGSSSRNEDHGANGTAIPHEPSSSTKPTQPTAAAPSPAPIPPRAVVSMLPRITTPPPAPAPAPAVAPATPPAQRPAAVRASPSSGTGTSPGRRRTNPSSTLRYSVVSNTSGNTAENRPQRKKSTLRGAFSKLFGRKKKNKASIQSSGDDTDRTSSVVPSTQHRSDTSALERVNEAEPKRSASLPITEYDRALRSHSVGPNDITAIESARNSMHLDGFTGNRRRAVTATQSNMVGARNLYRRHEFGEWGGLSPRPVSSHARGSRLIQPDEDPAMIGRAITSDMAGEYAQKRRSRSLSGLDLPTIPGSSGSARRRSDEIRYWRESYGPSYLSPLSSTHPDNEGESAAFNDDTGVLSVDPSQAPSTVQPSTEAAPKTPPQPFNFGSFATMNEMAGMKITQAVGLDERMGSLESRTHRLERVVDQLCHSVPGFRGPIGELAAGYGRGAPRSVPVATGFDLPAPSPSLFGASPSASSAAIPHAALPAISLDLSRVGASSSRYSCSRQSAETTEGDVSRMSFGDGQTFIGSMHPPSSAATQNLPIPAISAHSAAPSPGLRPNSNSTVRGATSLPALAAAAAAQEHHLASSVDAMAAQLEAERAARAALELQVKKLSERMNTLSSTMYAMLRDPHKSRSQERLTTSRSYERLTPGPAGDNKLPGVPEGMPSSQSRLLSKTSNSSLSLSSPLGQALPTMPQMGTTSFGGNSGKPPIVKTLSVFEGQGDEEDSEHEDASAFQTPREEQSPHPYGAFGEDLRGETDEGDELDPRRKKAARTLSLSQLTLGPGVQGNVI
ncbi:hypothetical protein MAPG_06651 [Magnaporthiopsis poae ATCC 64411]|uniref:Uncharacterized protein n=1 Tax=Magnaporthiopsis poae (strain ATCC 64411 / 73-15) TaxID=644358 RepID=A0A0C4E2L0_MAGP6|nr:hypothetical protein MAPG_06651 [Magnaporthiopsis poae ATCC 64411]